MRISDWSSDVCSSDLLLHPARATGPGCLCGTERAGSPGPLRESKDECLHDGSPRKDCRSACDRARQHRPTQPHARPVHPSVAIRSEEHTSELQSLMRISYAVFCLKKKKTHTNTDQQKTNNTHRKHNATHTHT